MLPNVPVDGIYSKPSWLRHHGLDTLWPMLRLSTHQAFASCLVLQGLGVCHRASLEGG